MIRHQDDQNQASTIPEAQTSEHVDRTNFFVHFVSLSLSPIITNQDLTVIAVKTTTSRVIWLHLSNNL